MIVRFAAEETLDRRSPRKSGTDVNHGGGYAGVKAQSPVKTVTASLYCGGAVEGTTPSAPLSSRGDAELDGTVTVPSKCLQPTVLVHPNGGAGVYIAASGFGG